MSEFAWCVCECQPCELRWTVRAVEIAADPPGRYTKPATPQRCPSCDRVVAVIGLCRTPMDAPQALEQEGLWG